MSSHGVPRSEGERSPEQLKKDIEKISKYKALENQLHTQTSESRFDLATLELTTKLLRINPEYYTVWNVRRRCLITGYLAKNCKRSPLLERLEPSDADEKLVAPSPSAPQTAESDENELQQHQPDTSSRDTEQGRKEIKRIGRDTGQSSDAIRDELIFTVPLLMGHPKCYWIWNYRMWILEQATLLLPTVAARTIWQEELGLVSKMLDRDRRNYHAWAYRRYVVSHLESSKLEGQSMTEVEFSYTTKMIGNDLSNFSAWHNRAQLIPRLLEEREADDVSRRAFLDKEFEMVDNGLNVGPEDQSLWYYHQYLTLNVAEQPVNLSILAATKNEDRVNLISKEIDFIRDLLDDYKDVKWIYEMLLEYTLLIHKLDNKPFDNEQKAELEAWMSSIKRLDPQRSNRWKELARELEVSA
ncbi:hypothetical protein PWT90_04463 [Aphanocladium album]|nr:hypothetical protein PWT90_04463 [Aphanocladium album]